MEDGKKRSGSEEDSGRRTKRREPNEGETVVTEDEVEEFYAILRRIHVAVRYFEKGNGTNGDHGRKPTEKDASWRPSFRCDDFREVNDAVKLTEKRDGDVEENVVFDLNADPEPESETPKRKSLKE